MNPDNKIQHLIVEQIEANNPESIQSRLQASNYNKRFNDNAVSINGYNTNKMLKLDCTNMMDTGVHQGTYANIEILCPKTGIITGLVMPILPASNHIHFTVLSPFAEFDNCLKLASLGSKNLELLDAGILAGIVLSMYSTLNLVITRDNALVSNCILKTCSKEILIKAINLAKRLTVKNSKHLSQLDIDYEVHKIGYSTFETPFINFLKLLNDEVIATGKATAIANEAGIITIKHSYTPPPVKNSISSSTKSVDLIAFEKDFIACRNKAKEALRVLNMPLLALGYTKLLAHAKIWTTGKAMLSVSRENKNKMIYKFKEINNFLPIEQALLVSHIINFIDMAYNDEDVYGKVGSLLGRLSDSFDKPKLKTLAEIIADKKAQSLLLLEDKQMPIITNSLLENEKLLGEHYDAE